MDSSNYSRHKLPEEVITDHIFSQSDAKTALSILQLNKKYSLNDSIWRKLLPSGFPLGSSAREFALNRMIKSEADLIPKIRNFMLNLEQNKNSMFQCAFIKPNATYEQCVKNPSVKLTITFPKPTAENEPENYLFANEFTPSCMTHHPQLGNFDHLQVESSYFAEGTLPPSLEAIKAKGKELMMEYLKNNTEIDCTLEKTNPRLFYQEIISLGIHKKIADFIDKSMPEENALLNSIGNEKTSIHYKNLNDLIMTEVLKIDLAMNKKQTIRSPRT